MKRKIVFGLVFLFSGLVVGNNLYNKINVDLLPTFSEKNQYYLLQAGVYSTKERMQEETRDIKPKIYQEEEGKYHVYVGLTTKKENSKKIKAIYEKQGIDIYEKEINVSDEELYNNVVQFDILIENTNHEDEILTIEEVVLATLEKTLKNN